MHKTPAGRTVENYADGNIRVHDGHSPKTIIDIPKFNTHISIHKFGPFEFNKANEIDEVFVAKGHHKNKFVVAFNDSKDATPYGYDVWSSEGIIGKASGKRLDLLIASLFYDDPKINNLIKGASMDDYVKRYLKFALITAGTNIRQI